MFENSIQFLWKMRKFIHFQQTDKDLYVKPILLEVLCYIIQITDVRIS